MIFVQARGPPRPSGMHPHQENDMRCLRKVAAVLLAVAAGTAPTASVEAQQPTGVVFENVRIFDRSSDRLTEPSNVLIVGNIIKRSV